MTGIPGGTENLEYQGTEEKEWYCRYHEVKLTQAKMRRRGSRRRRKRRRKRKVNCSFKSEFHEL